MPKAKIQRSFPGLAEGEFRVTGPPKAAYNCAAWAVSDTAHWWEPTPGEGGYWPEGVSRAHSLEALIGAFARLGFEKCPDARAEPGVEKLALYADETGSPTHVARQLPSGKWTSKLGASEDIEHASAEALQGILYGKVVRILRRPAVAPTHSEPGSKR
jgi:hypothetical protein